MPMGEQIQTTLTWSEADFSQFHTFNEPSLQEALHAAVCFMNEISANTSARWLSFTGLSGLGKTFLTRMIFEKYRKQVRPRLHRNAMNRMNHSTPHISSYDCEFAEWGDISEEIKRGNWAAANHLIQPHLVVIDDIGDDESGSKMDGITADKLYRLLCSRMNKWTIITSNLDLRDIAAKERRIASRMIRDGNIHCGLTGEDFGIRQLKTNTKN